MIVPLMLFSKHCTASPSPWEYAFGNIKFDITIRKPELVTEKKNIFINKVNFKDLKSTAVNINNDGSEILYILIYASTFNKITNSDENQDGGSIYLYHCSSFQLFVTSVGSTITDYRQGIHCYIEYESVTDDKTVINCSSIDQATNGGSTVCLKKGQQMMSSTNISNTFALRDSAYFLYYGSQTKENVIEYGNFIKNTATKEYGIMSHERSNYIIRYSIIYYNKIWINRRVTGIITMMFTPNYNNVLSMSYCNVLANESPKYTFYCGRNQNMLFTSINYHNFAGYSSEYNNGNIPNSPENIIDNNFICFNIKKDLKLIQTKMMNPFLNRSLKLHPY